VIARSAAVKARTVAVFLVFHIIGHAIGLGGSVALRTDKRESSADLGKSVYQGNMPSPTLSSAIHNALAVSQVGSHRYGRTFDLSHQITATRLKDAGYRERPEITAADSIDPLLAFTHFATLISRFTYRSCHVVFSPAGGVLPCPELMPSC